MIEVPKEVEELDLTDLEIIQFENGDDDVFNSSDSFIEIPDLE